MREYRRPAAPLPRFNIAFNVRAPDKEHVTPTTNERSIALT